MARMFLLIVFIFLSFPLTVQAQDFTTTLTIMNQTPVERSPRYKSADLIFDMHVLDVNRQLIGSVYDLLIDESGDIVQIVCEITRIGSSRFKITRNYEDVVFREGRSSFEVPIALAGDGAKLEQMVAKMQSPAPETPLYSVRNFIGTDVQSVSGQHMGVVKSILFHDEVEKAEVIVMEDIPGARRYDRIGIPYNPEVISVGTSYGRHGFLMERAPAQELTEFARARR